MTVLSKFSESDMISLSNQHIDTSLPLNPSFGREKVSGQYFFKEKHTLFIFRFPFPYHIHLGYMLASKKNSGAQRLHGRNAAF